MPHFETSAASDARRAWIGVGVPILGLVAVIIALAVATFASFARDQDRAFEQTSRTLVANGLEGRARAAGNVGLDYANWQEMFDSVSVRWNQSWVEGNIYSSVAEGMIIFRADGEVRYSWFNEEFAGQADPLAAAIVGAAVKTPNLRRLARARTVAETVAYTYARFGDQLLVIAVIPVTPEDDAARLAHDPLRGYDYLAVTEIISPLDMARAGTSMSLRDFHFAGSPQQASRDIIAYPVVAAGAPVGELRWRHARPGAAAFRSSVWPVVLALLGIGVLTLLVARSLVMRQINVAARAAGALQSARLKAEFLARVSHELRTPLNAIIGYAEIIQEEYEEPNLREDSNRIIAAARHLAHLLNDILDQSRLDAGRIKFSPEVLPVAGLLAELQGLVRPAANANNVTLEFTTSPHAVFAYADHVRLRQCLLNLIGNAIKFAPNGQVSVKPRAAVVGDRAMVVFDVTDDGIGIAKADLGNLFRPFSQANAGIGARFGGTGLGLSISRDLACAMGGDITVTSEVGKGSTFSLSVPAATASALKAA